MVEPVAQPANLHHVRRRTMQKSVILFVAAVTFLSLEITAHAGKPVCKNRMPFGNGLPSGYHFNLNILGEQGHFTFPPPEYGV